jgi:hypothetical protein
LRAFFSNSPCRSYETSQRFGVFVAPFFRCWCYYFDSTQYRHNPAVNTGRRETRIYWLHSYDCVTSWKSASDWQFHLTNLFIVNRSIHVTTDFCVLNVNTLPRDCRNVICSLCQTALFSQHWSVSGSYTNVSHLHVQTFFDFPSLSAFKQLALNITKFVRTVSSDKFFFSASYRRQFRHFAKCAAVVLPDTTQRHR